MELKQWFDAERGRQTRLAQAMTAENPTRPVHGAFLAAMASDGPGARPVPPRLAPAIERLTAGAVMRWDARPDDWWEIWPELRDRRGAPDVPSFASESMAV